MQTNEATLGETDLTENDLGPLAWVLEELKKSLDGATKAMRRFVRDAELARGSDLAELDASQLRIARQQLHQAVGALEMVGFSAQARVLRAMEALAQKFILRPELCSDDAATKMERASFALAEYLEGVLKGKTASPVALFPQYRDVLDMVGGERVHPADLWPLDWSWVDAPLAVPVIALSYAPEVRARLDQAVLTLVKTGDANAAAVLRDLALGLAQSQAALQPRVFWKICAAFFEATAKRLCPNDVYAKRSASRVLMQYASLAKGELTVSDRLAQDLLFFCSQADPAPASDAPVLNAVRNAYHLTQTKPFNYEMPQFGRFDPAVLVQARKRIATATETWSALAGGDTNRLKVIADQFVGIADSVLKLHPESGDLARALTRAIDVTVRSGEPPSTPIAMEVATAVLYLEAAYDDLDPTESDMAARSLRLAQRLEHVSAGGQSEPLESWMEDLYRRVSDRQTMGSVVDELRTTLGEIEKSLDQFFRNPKDKSPVQEVPSKLAQMRGVFSVLGLDQASTAMLRMRDSVEKLLVDDVTARGSAGFEKLGSSIGALGFLIDMLSYQRAMAKKLFVYDDAVGEFKPVMGREKIAPAQVNQPIEPIQAGPAAAQGQSPLPALSIPRPGQAATNPAPAHSALEEPNAVAPQAATMAIASLTAVPLPVPATNANDLATAASLPVSVPVSTPVAVPLDDDEAEIRDIFLEEAAEVVQNGLAAVEALRHDPSNLADQTTLRRAFHTLKGSSRMVGLNEFGEAAWSMEQLLNAWLAEQKPASGELVTLSEQAMTGFGVWVGHIAARTDAEWRSNAFRQAADALRLNGQLTVLNYPGFTPQAQPKIELPLAAIEVDEGTTLTVHPDPMATELPMDLAATDLDLQTPSVLPQFMATSIHDATLDTVVSPEFQATNFLVDRANDKAQGGPPFQNSAAPKAFADSGLDDFDFGAEPLAVEFAATTFAASTPDDALTFSSAAPDASPSEPMDMLDLSAQDIETVFPDQAGIDLTSSPAIEPIEAVSSQASNFHGAAADGVPEESVRVIGSLRIDIPLYNVFLNEADEWSRRLQTELGEWALELHQMLPDSCIALAHSLSGSSATVGFTALSDIARWLEQAMQHVQLHGRGETAHAKSFNEAAEEIRHLLHQFAAGFLKDPDRRVLTALQGVVEAEFAASSDVTLESLDFSQSIDLPSVFESAPPPSVRALADAGLAPIEPLPPVIANAEPEPEPASWTVTAAAAAAAAAAASMIVLRHDTARPSPPPAADPAVHHAQAALPAATLTLPTLARAVLDADDDIDLNDSLDADLFPIFEEEALELLPQLGGALRQWSARPENLGARGEALRVLHTLKGSARLAGAMRLGEMTHRVESAIEQLGTESLEAPQIESLLTRFDSIQGNFDALRAGPPQALVLPELAKLAIDEGLAADPDPLAIAALPTSPPVRGMAPTLAAPMPARQAGSQTVRVRSQLLDRLVNQAGEVIITRSRLEARMNQLRSSLVDLTGNLDRLRLQLRDIEVQAESQMQSRMALAKETSQQFDPLEFDRFTRVQELTRMMAESVNDVATVQRNLQRSVEGTEDDLIAQARQARELQRDLLRTRMVEFEGISDRLYGVVRQAGKDAGKQVKLDINGGSMDIDRGVLERMAPAFEHLLRNAVAHGIEPAPQRLLAGKPAAGAITISLEHQSNELSVTFSDDGAGLDLQRIRDKAVSSGVAADAHALSDADAANLIFLPGFSTAAAVTELSGRGVGMDVVRTEMNALGGRIETTTERGRSTRFKLVLPLTTAVTHVVMLRLGELAIGVPANVIDIVRRVPAAELETAYTSGVFIYGHEPVPFYWGGALLQASSHSNEATAKHMPVAIFRSAGQRVAAHVDEVLGNQEVVVKNLGPQLSRLPGLTGMSVLASGAVVLIYNPVALASVYGDQAKALRMTAMAANTQGTQDAGAKMPSLMAGVTQAPLVMVVDDSITVRRVTQRLLKREGYRVVMAADGLQALERLQDEKPTVVLSDIEMPRMDGFDLARNIRADARLRDLPIIMITSRIAEKHREHARELGVDHYLGKPYSEDQLLTLVRDYCKNVVEG